MKYNEELARNIIEKYKLSLSTLSVWKNRNQIPDKYNHTDYVHKPKNCATTTISISLKLDKKLYEILSQIKNRNRFINISIREKLSREGIYNSECDTD